MKCWVTVDEWYPVLDVQKEKTSWTSEDSIELTEEQYDYIRKVFDEFDRVQEKLNKLTNRGFK